MSGGSGKLSTAEVVIFITLAVVLDLVELGITALSLITAGAAEILKYIITVPAWLLVQGWLYLRGVSGGAYLTGNLIELIPVLSILPARTLAAIVTVIQANTEIGKITEALPNLKKGGVAGVAKTILSAARGENAEAKKGPELQRPIEKPYPLVTPLPIRRSTPKNNTRPDTEAIERDAA